jgi:hypothetical protein
MMQFLWAATADYTPFLGIPAAIEFFERHSAQRIQEYNHKLATEGGAYLAKIWGTETLVAAEHCTSLCVVRLPGPVNGADEAKYNYTTASATAFNHHLRSLVSEIKAFHRHFNRQLRPLQSPFQSPITPSSITISIANYALFNHHFNRQLRPLQSPFQSPITPSSITISFANYALFNHHFNRQLRPLQSPFQSPITPSHRV